MQVPPGTSDHAPPPSPRSPTKAGRLSPSMIIGATGQETLEELEELEMIFGAVSEIGGLERCTSLRSLTLIDCGLRRISNLEPVGHSLIKMCLCDQGLKKMEGLCLPGLQELYLHQNKIAKIEGLEGCPSLRRLWLFSNRITAMEGLHHCGALRELWLQDNKITAVAGVRSLVHLQNLGIAGNPIAGVRHMSSLRGLPSLMELTLDDIHFGTCPVVAAEGYRDFVIRCLPQVRRLDGLEVMEADRAEVEHKYQQEALTYQESLEEIERRSLDEIQQAEMARDGGVERSSEVKAEMMAALRGLEDLIKEGRDKIATEMSRQEEVQASNLLELESNLSELQRQYCKEVDKRVQVEEAKAKEEERLFSALEERTRSERDYAQLVARQQARVVDGVAVQELSDHSPDFQRLRMELLGNQKTQSGQVELMNVLRACRLYNRGLCEAFLAADGGRSSPTVRLYLGVSGSEEMEVVCSAGLSALGRSAVVLFPDPRQAAAAAVATATAATAVTTPTSTSIPTSTLASTAAGTPPAASGADTAATALAAAATAAEKNNGLRGAIILQLAVILPQGQLDTVLQDRLAPRGGAGRSGARPAPPRGPGKKGGGGSVSGGGEGGAGGAVSAALIDRAAASGRVTRVTIPKALGGERRGAASSSLSSLPNGRADAAAAAAAAGGRRRDGEDEAGNGADQDTSCCFILPGRCFRLALPEFHVLCASGAVGEDRRALEGALSKLSTDNMEEPAPTTDLLAQLEIKMEEQVKAYLERMQEDVTPAQASRLQATQGNLRWKAANLASLKAGVDDQRALQETLLCQEEGVGMVSSGGGSGGGGGRGAEGESTSSRPQKAGVSAVAAAAEKRANDTGIARYR